jgi:hypothetical protein
MLAVIALSAAVVIGAADVKNEAWVVVTKRSGVAKPAALEMAKTVSATLVAKGIPNPTEPADLSSCNAKLLCLIEAAMKQKISVLITIETASVLDDVVIHTEALSVEEDGRKIGAFDYEGPVRQFSADAVKAVDDSFAPAIRSALGIAAAPIAKDVKVSDAIIAAPPPEAKAEPEPVAPAPPPAVVAEAPSPGVSTQKVIGWVAAGAGVVSLGVAVGLGVKAMGAAGQQKQLCPAGQPCTNPAAFARFDEARSAQSTAVVFAVVGGVLAAGGATLLLVDFGGSKVALTPTVSSEGAGVVFDGRF